MRRVLIAADEYNELVFLETLLKKVGLQLHGVQNPSAIPNEILSFGPEIIVFRLMQKKADTIAALQKIRKSTVNFKLLLLLPKGRGIDKEILSTAQADAAIESPVNPAKFVEAVGKLGGLDYEALVTKYKKIDIKIEAEVEETVHVKSLKKDASKIRGEDRSAYYERMAKSEPLPPFEGFKKPQIKEQVAEFREREKDEDIQNIDQQRQEFVQALFKKK